MKVSRRGFMGLLAALTSSVSIPARAGAEAVKAASAPVPESLVGAELTSLMYQGGPVYVKRIPVEISGGKFGSYQPDGGEYFRGNATVAVRCRYYDSGGYLIPDGAIMQGAELQGPYRGHEYSRLYDGDVLEPITKAVIK